MTPLEKRQTSPLEDHLRKAIEKAIADGALTPAQIARECFKKFATKEATVTSSIAKFRKGQGMTLKIAGPIADVLGLHFTEPDSAVEAARELGEIGWPTYIAELESRRLEYLSSKVLTLLGYETHTELHSECQTIDELCHSDDDLVLWQDNLRSSGFAIEPRLELRTRYMKGRLYVQILGVVIQHLKKKMIVGLMIDVTNYVVEMDQQKEFVKKYREILDLPWGNICMHEVHRNEEDIPEIIKVNIPERRLLDIPDNQGKFDFTDLAYSAPGETRSEEQIRDRVKLKLVERLPFNKDVCRTFVKPASRTTSTPETVPVSISDIGVHDFSSRENHYAAILTIVRDMKIPEDIAQLLRDFGAKYPPLESLHVSTLIKSKVTKAESQLEALLRTYPSNVRNKVLERVKRRLELDEKLGSEESIVFIYGNELFLRRLAKSTGDNVRELPDLMGKTEDELFSQEYFGEDGPKTAALYRKADRFVLDQSEVYQSTENHPVSKGENVTVQVLKTPLLSDKSEPPIGLQVFFWDVDSWNDLLIHEIRKLTDSKKILDLVPVPIYRKDEILRFVYANPSYLKDISNGIKRELALHDVIGMTDKGIFDKRIAAEYESIDRAVLKTGKEISRVEMHFGRKVKVIKSPVFVPLKTEAVGVQGIFWNLESEEPPLAELQP